MDGSLDQDGVASESDLRSLVIDRLRTLENLSQSRQDRTVLISGDISGYVGRTSKLGRQSSDGRWGTRGVHCEENDVTER